MTTATRDAWPIVAGLEASIEERPPAREAEVPDELPDRAADAWEPLLAIADAASGNWPARARRAAIVLHADRAEDDSLGLRLLSDTRLAFDRLGDERVATLGLIEALQADEESPWVDDRHPLTAERLARLLRPFGIRSRQMKVDGVNVRGFVRESFVDSWERYVPEVDTRSDWLPRYPDHAAGSGVAGFGGGGLRLGAPADDEPAATVACSDYRAHQFAHRQTQAGWTCDRCSRGRGDEDSPGFAALT